MPQLSKLQFRLLPFQQKFVLLAARVKRLRLVQRGSLSQFRLSKDRNIWIPKSPFTGMALAFQNSGR